MATLIGAERVNKHKPLRRSSSIVQLENSFLGVTSDDTPSILSQNWRGNDVVDLH